MKICIISSQILGFGKIGGFGNMTRLLAIKLTQAGHKVVVVVPRRKGQKEIEYLDGFKIIGLSPFQLNKKDIFQKIDADIYHSQNPTISTTIALKAQPNKSHVVTLRDPRDWKDWKIELQKNTWKRKILKYLGYLFEGESFLKKTIRNVNIVGVPAHFLIKKAEDIYKRTNIHFMPNLVYIPKSISRKSLTPQVCFVGRLDKVKNPERFFKLATAFPEVDFITVGSAQDTSRQKHLEKIITPNVKLMGTIDKFKSHDLDDIYQSSWILVNTSFKEALPATFIEAAAHGCAILSKHNPDNFSSEFGYHCEDGDFEEGLSNLLLDNNWREKGQKAHKYVKEIYDEEIAFQIHLEIYKDLILNEKS